MLRYGVALWPFSLECFKGILACTIFQCWREIMVSSGRLVVRPVKVPRWLSSQVEWLKLNLDGFALGKPGQAGFGFCLG